MRLGLKVMMVIGLTLAILVPLMLIRGTIAERQQYRNEVVGRIASSYAGNQALAGPVLVVPYEEQVEVQEKDAQGRPYTVRRMEAKEWMFFPKSVDLSGKLLPSVRKLGLHEVRVYELQAVLAARFDASIPADPAQGAPRRIGKPWLAYRIRDVRGLTGDATLTLDGGAVPIQQGVDEGNSGGVHVRLPEPQAGAKLAFDTRFQFALAGTEALSIAPLGDRNRFAIQSTWPHPQFNGAFLPRTRKVDANGFRAEWEISSLATDAQAQYRNGAVPVIAGQDMDAARAVAAAVATASAGGGALDAVGISLVDPVNVYTQADRATKYGLLFIGLTFVGFFMFELIKQLRVHPIQYLLVGLALAIFFLLLVSLSEHIAFGWAYLVASVACLGLLGFYVSFVLHSRARGFGFAAMLGLLYAALYGLLISEDNALVLGAGLLFAILAAIMVITRKVDWYQLSSDAMRARA